MKIKAPFAVLIAIFAGIGFAFGDEIHDAARDGDLEKIKTLVKAKPDLVSSKDAAGLTPLHIAAVYGRKEMAEFLLAKNSSVNAKANHDETPLRLAITSKYKDSIKDMVILLLDNKADVNAKDQNGLTPLHAASYKGYKEVVELLIAHGADINAKDVNGSSPLQLAKKKEYEAIVVLLKQHGGR
jgi:ankyrin repeat protein